MSTIKFYLDNNSEVVLEDDGKKDLTEDLLSLIKSDNICFPHPRFNFFILSLL